MTLRRDKLSLMNDSAFIALHRGKTRNDRRTLSPLSDR